MIIANRSNFVEIMTLITHNELRAKNHRIFMLHALQFFTLRNFAVEQECSY